ncbi:hypothetical protein M1D97_12215 [Kushneria sp. AK178]
MQPLRTKLSHRLQRRQSKFLLRAGIGKEELSEGPAAMACIRYALRTDNHFVQLIITFRDATRLEAAFWQMGLDAAH